MGKPFGSALDLRTIETPGTPATGTISIYAKSDGNLYRKDSAGTESQVGGGAAAGTPAPLFAVSAATTANITLSGEQTVDGVAVVAGNAVLVKAQSTASANGVYTASTGAWTRHPFFTTSTQIAGSYIRVLAGTNVGGEVWRTNFNSTQTVGTTSMNWYRVVDNLYVGNYGLPLQMADMATTANVTLSGTGAVIDGVTVAGGDVILVKNQTTASQNGLYVARVGAAWNRYDLTDTAKEMAANMVRVRRGTANGGSVWLTTFKETDTLGTTDMNWYQVPTLQVTDARYLDLTTADQIISARKRVMTGEGAIGIWHVAPAATSAATMRESPTVSWSSTYWTGAASAEAEVWMSAVRDSTISGDQRLSVSGSHTSLQANRMRAGGIAGATLYSRFCGSTSSGAPTSGTWQVGDFVIAHNGVTWVCTTAGTPGTWTSSGIDDTGWITTGITASTAASPGGTTVTSQRRRRIGRQAEIRVIGTNSNAYTVPATGDIVNLTLCTIPTGWAPVGIPAYFTAIWAGDQAAGRIQVSSTADSNDPTTAILYAAEGTGATRTVAAGATWEFSVSYMLD